MYYECFIRVVCALAGGDAEGGPVALLQARALGLRQDFRSGHLSLITDTGAQLQPQCGDDFQDSIKTWAAFT